METLVHDSINDALRTTIQVLGKSISRSDKDVGAKVVGGILWPEKSPDKAGELLSNCLNADRPEKLSLEQFMWIMREGQKIGMHAIPDFIGRQCGYKFEPIEHIDEMAELMKRFNESVAIQASIVERLEALKK